MTLLMTSRPLSKLFADDISLIEDVDIPRCSAVLINRDMDKIYEWSNKCLADFNPKKGKQ